MHPISNDLSATPIRNLAACLRAAAMCVIATAALSGAEDPLRAQHATQPTWPANTVIKVANYPELERALGTAHEDTTILLADGTYQLERGMHLKGNKASLRGESGNRDKVILDGAKLTYGEAVFMEEGADQTVANLSIQNCAIHGIRIGLETLRPSVFNVHFHNIWERCIKGGMVGTAGYRIVGCKVQYCLFENDTPKQADDNAGGDYIGGCDMMQLKDTLFSDNVFIGIRGKNSGGRGAIFFWNGGEDVIIERNRFMNCDRSIALGNPSGEEGVIHMTRGIIRNNFIVRGAGDAIEMARTKDCEIYNNSIWSDDLSYTCQIHMFQGPGGHKIYNNLMRVTPLDITDPNVTQENNVLDAPEGTFVDPKALDLHLTAKGAELAKGKGKALAAEINDFDGEPRGASVDLGADQSGKAK